MMRHTVVAEAHVDIESVRTFLLVASEGSYARAAPHLFRSVSALSRRVQELERELDVTLFERTSKGILLSAEGRDLLEPAQVLVDAADAMLNGLRQKSPHAIRLGVAPGLTPLLRAAVIEAFHDHGIDDLILVPGENTQLIRKMLSNQIDIALSHQQPQSKELSYRLVGAQQTKIMVGANSPLARKTPLYLKDLVGTPFVTYARLMAGAPIYYAQLRVLLAEAGIDEIVQSHEMFRISETIQNAPGFGIWVTREEDSTDPSDSPAGVVVRSPEDLDLPLPTFLIQPLAAEWLTVSLRASLEALLPSIGD